MSDDYGNHRAIYNNTNSPWLSINTGNKHTTPAYQLQSYVRELTR